MRRALRLAGGAAAAAALVVLVGGIPWALWHFVGWPLPHHLPTAGQVGRALDRQAIPAQALVDALAVVVWLAWGSLLASLAVELPAALAGRQARRLPVAGVLQPLTGRLVAAVVVAGLSLAPRPAAHPAAVPLASRLPPAAARPPATLVLATAATPGPAPAPAPSAAPSAAASVTPGAPTPPASAGPPSVYVVQRGDTLWGIAERQLGDPLRWSEIFALNQGRPQPGGATLTDPHWIDPGWTLLLPSAPAAAPQDPQPGAPAMPSPPVPAPAPAGHLPGTPPANPAHPETPPPHRISAPSTPQQAPSGVDASPVQLPSGSVVAGSFAAGVLATVALGRLRRRHAYRYHAPEPGRDLRPAPLRPTLRHLAATLQPDDGTDSEAPPAVPVFPVADDERRLDPGRLEVGRRDGQPVVVELSDLCGTAIRGPAADDVARAIAAGLVVRAGPGAAEICCTTRLAGRLFPEASASPGLRQAADPEEVARVVEAERIARTRRIAAAEVPDAARFRHDHPENPLPLLVVFADQLDGATLGRLRALVAETARLAISIVFLGACPAATGEITLDESATVTAARPAHLAEMFLGANLHRLRAEEAVEVLGAVHDAEQQPDEDGDEPPATLPAIASLPGAARPDADDHDATGRDTPDSAPGQAWPQPPSEEAGDAVDAERPITVSVLGPYRIAFRGETVTTGLRARAKLLLAWSLLRPEGATIDEIVDALWPDTPPERVLKQFWYALGDLRSFFRAPGGDSLEVLDKLGEHYRPSPAEIACDLWAFQGALGDAARAGDEETARKALRRAAGAYRGDLLAGADYHWVEPVRQDLHRRAVDAHLRLAELEERARRPDAAAEVLEQVIDLDRYAEEPYRRLMALHAAGGRLDQVSTTWQLLRRRLADLDVEVEQATVRLYRTLTQSAGDQAATGERPIRRLRP